ncbi:MAG: GerAB/ArcD/ProY family transporter, partial [Bacillota bacterium]
MNRRSVLGKEEARISTERIANRQLLFILFIMRTTIVIASMPVLTTANAAQDAWASVVVACVGALALVIVIGALGTRFPDQTLMEYSQKLVGTIPGKIISLIYLWVFLFLAAIDLRIYGEALITGFIPETPLVFIVTSMVIASAFAAYSGIEAIGRNADFIFPL